MDSKITDEERLVGALPVTSAAEAIREIEDDDTILISGFGSVGYPKEIPLALADSERDLSLTVISGGNVGPEIDESLVEADAVSRRYPYLGHPAIREKVNQGRIAYHDRNISTLGDEVQFGNFSDSSVAVVEAIAVGQDWLTPSTSIGHTPAYVESADRLIVEVTSAAPVELGEFHDVYRPGIPPDREPIPLRRPDGKMGTGRVEFDADKLTAVVKTSRRDQPYSFRDPSEDDLAIADNLGRFIEDEVERSPLFEDSMRIQFGVGSLGNALMSVFGQVDLGERELIYFGEVIQDGILDLLDDGTLSSASATSLALSTEGQERLFRDVERYAEDIVLRPADISNSPTLIDRFGVVSVNSALEVDIFGHVNSTHIDGSHVVSGVGGSGDFNRNSPLTVLALPSTAKSGAISRIVPMVPHVDHTEHDIDVVVTERGVADIRGKSPRETAALLIQDCAHPEYRPRLQAYLDEGTEKGGHIPHSLEESFSWHLDR